MGVFGFIENFFFISLGIVFGLVLLLVYHFKKRMSVAEKKSESMYGLLSTVVREIKNIRSTFYTAAPAPSSAPSPAPAPPLAPSPAPNRNASSQPQLQTPPPKSQPEIITLELAASEIPSLPLSGVNKIVVSEDEDDDSESESESEDDDSESESEESESESDSESEDDDEVENIVLEPLVASDNQDLVLESNFVVPEEIQLDESALPTEVIPIAFEDFSSMQPESIEELREDEPEPALESKSDQDPPAPVPEPEPKEKYSTDNLRKMNINQLRTIAIQQGITADTSKMKKNELISIMQSN